MRYWLLLGLALSGCGATPSISSPRADETGRRIVGRGAPYAHESVDAATLARDVARRRALAWRIFERVTAPTPLAGVASGSVTMPAFLSWYDRVEIAEVAKRLYDEQGDAAKEGPGFAPEAVEQALETTFPPLVVDPASFVPDPRLSSSGAGAGFHGNMASTLFSEGMLRHYLVRANEIIDCVVDPEADLIAAKERGEVRSFSPCMTDEFPRDAVMIKARWELVDTLLDRVALDDFPTDAAALAHIVGPDSTTEIMRQTPMTLPPRADGMFVTRDRSGALWALKALHVATKEVDEWVWTTFWWSREPASDFGADRPASLDGAWRNYKMCTQSSFVERDPDPAAGVADSGLAAALRVLHDPAGKMANEDGIAGWCANPFIEGTFARSTCIGCHQAAGNEAGPLPGNALGVRNFPGDFSFAFEEIRSRLRALRDGGGDLPFPPPEPIGS